MSTKRCDLQRLIRANIQNMRPYSSARSEFSGNAEVFLDANENYRQFVDQPGRNRYPDPLQRELKRKVSSLLGLPDQNIFLGNGSDEAIDLLFRACCVPARDSVLLLPPTYGVYSVFAALNDIRTIEVPLDESYQIDTARVLTEATKPENNVKLIFICSPNNPTGNDIAMESIIAILKGFDGLVVVDEAYHEFSDQRSTRELLTDYENLVVLKTLSKAWGLANARLGMALASEELVGILNNIKYPYNISGPAQDCAIKALDAAEEVAGTIRLITEQRKALERELSGISYVKRIYPSSANFLLVKVSDPNRLYDALKEQGIIIRNRDNQPGCEGCVRITVGSVEENAALLAAMRALEGEI